MNSAQRKLLALICLFIGSCSATAFAQTCSEAIKRTKGSYTFRRAGESIEIPITPLSRTNETAGVRATACYPVSVELRWANGRNNGGVFRVTLLDAENQPIGGKQFSAFMYGNTEMSLTGIGAGSMYGRGISAVPATIIVSTIEPFRAPAGISYTVVWIANKAEEEDPAPAEQHAVSRQNNAGVVTSISRVSRLIGSTRVPLVQFEMKASQPLPVKDLPLRLRIGERVFVNELSGDYTGRLLTLSLTPEMFDELQDRAEVVAFYDEDDSWSFGTLDKKLLKE